MNFDKNFEKNMNQLILLLRKIISNLPSAGALPKLPASFKDSGLNLNLCFFTFIPMLPEEIDELAESAEDAEFFREEKRADDYSSHLNAEDIDFLRRHGIQF